MHIKPQTVIPKDFPVTKCEPRSCAPRFDNVSAGYTPHTRPQPKKTQQEILQRATAKKL